MEKSMKCLGRWPVGGEPCIMCEHQRLCAELRTVKHERNSEIDGTIVIVEETDQPKCFGSWSDVPKEDCHCNADDEGLCYAVENELEGVIIILEEDDCNKPVRLCFSHLSEHDYCKAHLKQPREPGCPHVIACDLAEQAGKGVILIVEEN